MRKEERKKSSGESKATIEPSSGNVFADLDLDNAEELHMKAELTRQIYHRIQVLGLTQREAGKRLGLKQPEVSKLMKGRLPDFSTDRLLVLLKALEIDVDIVLRPHSEQNGHRGIVRVVEATA